jgi:hypothetical protein
MPVPPDGAAFVSGGGALLYLYERKEGTKADHSSPQSETDPLPIDSLLPRDGTPPTRQRVHESLSRLTYAGEALILDDHESTRRAKNPMDLLQAAILVLRVVE